MLPQNDGSPLKAKSMLPAGLELVGGNLTHGNNTTGAGLAL